MAIPQNLQPITVGTNSTTQVDTASIRLQRIPNNLLPVNASQISNFGSFDEFEAPEITEASTDSILNQVIPDSEFSTEKSFEEIRTSTLSKATGAMSGLVVSRVIPAPIPVGIILNFINTKIDKLKVQRQRASAKKLNEELKQRENPFTYRRSIINKQRKLAVRRRLDNQ